MAVVVFDAASFKIRYPEFSTVPDVLLSEYFGDATLYLSNSDCSPVQDVSRRSRLLNMLTAHLAYLGGALSADGRPGPVGRVSSATEGSVSISTEYATPGTAAWFTQTPYGAAFWQATSTLRGFRYVPWPTRY